MKVLLTGASGFVGSHIRDSLSKRNIPTVVLLRASSDRRFLNHHPKLQVCFGSINEPETLSAAISSATHVIHCAGCTRAVRPTDFYKINAEGTRNLVQAVNAAPNVERLVHISSLAVGGPATPAAPAKESDIPNPVSDYGKSKLAGELEVRQNSAVPFTVLRPPAVYGPRDLGFFSVFKAVNLHLQPLPSATQALSLVYVRDLAEAVVECLGAARAAGKIYYVAGQQITTARVFAEEVGRQMKRWTIRFPLPSLALWPICVLEELRARLTNHASLLNLQKFEELRARGWVCDPSLLQTELGIACPTPLPDGIARTLEWYREQKWL